VIDKLLAEIEAAEQDAHGRPDPVPVLRRCAADREIVELFEAIRESSGAEIHADGWAVIKNVIRYLAQGYGIEVTS
jgi:hypothetical protein